MDEFVRLRSDVQKRALHLLLSRIWLTAMSVCPDDPYTSGRRRCDRLLENCGDFADASLECRYALERGAMKIGELRKLPPDMADHRLDVFIARSMPAQHP